MTASRAVNYDAALPPDTKRARHQPSFEPLVISMTE